MIRKLMTGGLCLLLVNLFIASASAQTTNPKTAKRAEEIKAKVAKLGTGRNRAARFCQPDKRRGFRRQQQFWQYEDASILRREEHQGKAYVEAREDADCCRSDVRCPIPYHGDRTARRLIKTSSVRRSTLV